MQIKDGGTYNRKLASTLLLIALSRDTSSQLRSSDYLKGTAFCMVPKQSVPYYDPDTKEVWPNQQPRLHFHKMPLMATCKRVCILLKRPPRLRPAKRFTILNVCIKLARYPLLSNEKWFKPQSLIPWVFALPLTVFVTNHCTCSRQTVSLLRKEGQVCTQCSRWIVTMALYRGMHISDLRQDKADVSLNRSRLTFWPAAAHWSVLLKSDVVSISGPSSC